MTLEIAEMGPDSSNLDLLMVLKRRRAFVARPTDGCAVQLYLFKVLTSQPHQQLTKGRAI